MSDQIWITFHGEQVSVEHKRDSNHSRPRFPVSLFWFLGCVIGGAGYLRVSLFLERSIMPMLEPAIYSYGQQAGLFSFPLCIIIGGFIGLAIGSWKRKRFLRAQVILGLTSLFALWWILLNWLSDGIGTCTSEVVVFYPPLALCFVCLLLLVLAKRSARASELRKVVE